MMEVREGVKTKIIDTIEHAGVAIVTGDPVKPQYYYFDCPKCKSGLKSQPQFWRNVDDGIEVMCKDCAEKEGYAKVLHYESLRVLGEE